MFSTILCFVNQIEKNGLPSLEIRFFIECLLLNPAFFFSSALCFFFQKTQFDN